MRHSRQGCSGFELAALGVQVESIGAMGDPGDMVLTLEAIEQTRYAEYRYTVLAGRVAAICGLQRLDNMQDSEEGRGDLASAASEAPMSPPGPGA